MSNLGIIRCVTEFLVNGFTAIAQTHVKIPRLAKALIVLFSCLWSITAQAQTRTEQQKLAAVMVVVNSLLLDEQTVARLELNDFDDSPKTVNRDFSVYLDTQSQDVEFCFYLSALNTSLNLSPANLSVLINGVALNGDNQPVIGENCYSIPLALQTSNNIIEFSVSNGLLITLSALGVEPLAQSQLSLPSLTRSGWDERAVRKVLKIFAFGGHASHAQIQTWANMRPQLAIQEMLNFDQHNQKLSPLTPGEKYTETASQHGTLSEFYEFISSPSSDTPIPTDEREFLGVNGYRFSSTFGRMIAMRGLNPFRQRIGFFETNYHLAVNRNANVERRQVLTYYDAIMGAHEARVPYHEVIGVAAKSAAVAMQYGHRRNSCRNFHLDSDGFCRERRVDDPTACEFEGNADFAREIHQLFFGIFGVNDPNHENVTIENSARMLTGMQVDYIEDFGFDTEVRFNSCEHHKDTFGPLNILGQDISGVDAAAKIDQLMPISIQHEESLFNLPVYIIGTLADDSLTDAKRAQLRTAWGLLGENKDFLSFIHAYATSQMFHSTEHIKYLSSFERAYYQANKFNIDNIEAFLSNDNEQGRAGREIDDVIEGDNASEVFRPLHNVFGGQTSREASDSALAFERNYNRSATRESWQFNRELPSQCEGCDQGLPWSKDWSKVIPLSEGGYPAEYVAEWLWMHAIGNMDNFTDLERGQLVAILGAVRQPPVGEQEPNWQINNEYTFFDLNYLLCIRADRLDDGQTNNTAADLMSYDAWDDYCRRDSGAYSPTELAAFNLSFSGDQLANSAADPFPYLRNLISELAQVDVGLTNTDPIQRRRANERVQAALAFIFATPFAFAEGR